jgi:hypothetical protein
MLDVKWSYAGKDPHALEALEKRIADAGHRETIVTYSDLVRGVEFRLPTVQNGMPHQIDVRSWSGLDRSIIGEFLGYLSTQSYTRYGFMASALAVDSLNHQPSSLFFEWMYEIRALTSNTEDGRLRFWVEHLNKAYAHYKFV